MRYRNKLIAACLALLAGAAVACWIVVRSQTGRRQAEKERARSERRHRALVENAGIPHTVVAADGTILFANSVAARDIGTPPEALAGKPLREVAPGLADAYREPTRQVLATAAGLDFENHVQLPGGARWFHSKLQPVCTTLAARVTAVQIVSLDITARKQAEAALARQRGAAARDLRQLARHALPPGLRQRRLRVRQPRRERPARPHARAVHGAGSGPGSGALPSRRPADGAARSRRPAGGRPRRPGLAHPRAAPARRPGPVPLGERGAPT